MVTRAKEPASKLSMFRGAFYVGEVKDQVCEKREEHEVQMYVDGVVVEVLSFAEPRRS